jgi:hypothetical protein
VNVGEAFGASLFRGPNTRLRGKPGEKVTPAGGASVAYRRDIWARAGGFPEWLRFGSDPLFVEKVMQQNPRVTVAEEAVLYWQIGPRVRDVARRHYRREVDHWRLPWGRTGRRWLCFLAVLAASVAAALVWPPLWAAPPALVVLATGAQTARSLKDYRARGGRGCLDMAVAGTVLAAVHLREVLARTAGTFTGVVLSRRIRADWDAKRRAYLSI